MSPKVSEIWANFYWTKILNIEIWAIIFLLDEDIKDGNIVQGFHSQILMSPKVFEIWGNIYWMKILNIEILCKDSTHRY